MDLQTTLNILAIIVAVYTAYLQRRQLVGTQPNSNGRSGPNGRARRATEVWWKSPTVIAVFLIAILAWVPWVANRLLPQEPVATIGVSGWGGINLAQGLPVSTVVFKDDANLKMIAVAFHYDGMVDVFDVSKLQKSAPYDVRSGTTILFIKPDPEFLDEVATRKHILTNYKLLTIPTAAANTEFKTLRQATASGAKIIWSGTGPP